MLLVTPVVSRNSYARQRHDMTGCLDDLTLRIRTWELAVTLRRLWCRCIADRKVAVLISTKTNVQC